MRLYYGRMLRNIEYRAEWGEHPPCFVYRLYTDATHIKVYTDSTLDGIFRQLKADGHRIWGKRPYDYVLPPDNALEYLLFEAYLKADGFTEDEIKEAFSLNKGETR